MPFTKGVSGNSRGRWKKGQSGNPGGRPRGLRILLRERYGDDAKALVDVLHDLAFNSTNLDPEKRYRLVADLLEIDIAVGPRKPCQSAGQMVSP